MTSGDDAMRNTPMEPSTPVCRPDGWHCLPVEQVLAALATEAERGLPGAEAARRLAEGGANELVDRGARSPWIILWEQLSAVMVLILLGAAGLSLVLGKWLEAGAILAIVVLFVVLGFLQDYRAEKAIAALRKLAVPDVRVRRDGALRTVGARELVPGDVIVLEAGNLVPADVRFIECTNLRVQEAALTGESEAVEKDTAPLARADVPLGDRLNMGYMGTVVTYGRGRAVVVETGMGTELGKIATLIQEVKAELTPLQQRLDAVGKQLAAAGIAVAGLIMTVGLSAGEPLDGMILTAISVAVAFIPEGLPAVVTFTLALGAQRMLARRALIRKLPAVETLGSVTTICSDKTGTLTENRMSATAACVAGRCLRRGESGGFGDSPAALELLLAAGALCNDAVWQPDGPVGDPTEGALLAAAVEAGLAMAELRRALPRVAELPFDSERKRMSTLHRFARSMADGPPQAAARLAAMAGTPYVVFTKGAPDSLLPLATNLWDGERPVPMDEARAAHIRSQQEALARDGMRVLGVAFRPLAEPVSANALEEQLVFVGLVGLIDPPRPVVRQAVQTCLRAGIRPVMITGDHPLTACSIARELGISDGGVVLSGEQLSRMSAEQLAADVETVSVYARVTPEHKLKIVEALQRKGHIVAMTGDGINDAPALKKADIGVAMGVTGTDVAKEAADMVLLDDDFATIVAAVEEGRMIYDNLRRFIKFAVAGNVGKVGVMLLWPMPFFLTGQPLESTVAILPLQLLWLNLMTDGLLGLSMGVEQAEKRVMQRPPRSPADGVFSDGMGWQVAWVGGFIAAVTLAVGYGYYLQGLPQWQTMIFTTLAFLQIFQALATRSSHESLWRLGLFTNRLMVLVIFLIVLLQVAALTVPPLRDIFLRLTPLSPVDFLLCVGLGGTLLLAVEAEKWLLRRRQAR
ncbi:glr4215 [Gloeobacter violaceus PCC 7421]|uniref:Glr4215 protein n=2 Tax=Gloeobacter violaceus TaxID=33072 RepID=Q7NDM0_GLOVI|nr:glr4215 [Gloeobacter violaceus PCC 7421]